LSTDFSSDASLPVNCRPLSSASGARSVREYQAWSSRPAICASQSSVARFSAMM
jgi:hypothetical protein